MISVEEIRNVCAGGVIVIVIVFVVVVVLFKFAEWVDEMIER